MSEPPKSSDPNDPIIVRIEHVEHEIEEVKLYIEGVPYEAKSGAKRRLQYVEDMLSELKRAQQEAEVQKKVEGTFRKAYIAGLSSLGVLSAIILYILTRVLQFVSGGG